MAFLFGPGEWRGPRLGVRLDRVRAAVDEEADQLFATPTAGPAEGRTLEEVVTKVQARAGVECGGGEGSTLRRSCVIAHGHDCVEERGPESMAMIRRTQ